MKKNYSLLTVIVLIAIIGYSQSNKDDWITYVVEKEKGSMTVSTNLWYSYNGKPNYKNLLVVGTSTKNCKNNGYPDYLGLAKFYSFSDSIANRLDKLTKNRLIGVMTYQCAGFDIYYLKDTTSVRQDLQHFLDYNHALSKNYLMIKSDKKWTYYKSLVPKDLSESFFTNHEFLNSLVIDGDDLTKPRKVSHWINFKNERRRNNFATEIKKQNFSIDTLQFIKDANYKYQLKISRKDSVTPVKITKLTSELTKMALIYYGIYDGWGTKAIKEEE